MPIPNEDESKDDFLARCLGDENMNEEHSDEEERLAACNIIWDKEKEEPEEEAPEEEVEEEDLLQGETKFMNIPCSSEEARAWEKLQKELEKENLGFKRIFKSSEPETDESEWSDVSIINDNSIDADGEIVAPSGADLSRFRKNPIICLNHNYNDLPVGKALWLKASPKGNPTQIKMKSQYPKRPKDFQGEWRPAAVFALIQAGVLNGKSIGFIALEADEPSQKDVDNNPELENAERIITRWLMLECSVVTLPANENCVVESCTKHLKTLGIEFKKPAGKKIIVPKKAAIPMPKYIKSWDKIYNNVNVDDNILDYLKGRP